MIDFAYAADAAQPSLLVQFGPLVLIMFAFYFLMIRPQQKKMKAHQAMLASLKVGDRVLLASGFVGKITKIEERFFSVEIARNVDVQVERNAVSQKLDA
ncbi:preprotein translocase subunit YajC [Neisseria sp.]|uniref:preprotein translocase subunit YajC n=1 Tax=Neisseria sp. TaxID=192066 RepID=UPI00289BE94C|nr:preprotein translocase subunit YajC [Neisseria sp.]